MTTATARSPATKAAGAVTSLSATTESEPAQPGLVPADVALALPAVAAWAAAWLAWDPAAPGLAGVLALAGVATAVAAWLAVTRRRQPSAVLVALILLCAAAGGVSAGLRADAVRSSPVAVLAADRAYVHVDGVVTGDAYPLRPAQMHRGGPTRFALPLRVQQLRARGQSQQLRAHVLVVTTDASVTELLPSLPVRLSGRLAPGTRAGLAAFLAAPSVVSTGPPSAMHAFAGDLRAGLREAVAGLPVRERGLVPGLVLGDVSQLPAEVDEDFRTAGLTHLTAVSGANCAIVVGFVLLVFRMLGLPRRWEPVTGAVALGWFVVLARPQPSVLRAAAMGLLALAALATGRRRPAVRALSATVLALVLIDPALARSYGLALSVLATAGILLLGPPVTHRLGRVLPRWAAQAAAIPLAAYAACAPVLVLLDPRLSLVAVPANIVAAPLVAPATVLGVLATVSAPISAPLAAAFGWAAGIPARGLIITADIAASARWAAIPWPTGVTGATAVVLLLAVSVLGLRSAARRRALVPLAIGAGMVTAVALVVPLRPGWPPALRPVWPPAGWILVACDVGQGDALVLGAEPGHAVVVDAGPDASRVDSCLKRLAITHIHLVVVTHPHADHQEGLGGVLGQRSVAAVGVSALDPGHPPSPAVLSAAARAGVPVHPLTAGTRLRFGPLSLEVVWPRRVVRAGGSGENNGSVVLLAERAGVRMLLTGDVEPPAQRALQPHLPGRVDVLKVPHHGSAHQSTSFLAATGARVAMISSGMGNDYGHPAPGTVATLERLGMRVLRTDVSGDLAIVGDEAGLSTLTRGRSWVGSTS